MGKVKSAWRSSTSSFTTRRCMTFSTPIHKSSKRHRKRPTAWNWRWMRLLMRSLLRTYSFLNALAWTTPSSTSGKASKTRSWHRTTWTSPPVDRTASWRSSWARKTWLAQMLPLTSLASYSWSIWPVASVSLIQQQKARSKTPCNSRKPSRSTSLCSPCARSSPHWLIITPPPLRALRRGKSPLGVVQPPSNSS